MLSGEQLAQFRFAAGGCAMQVDPFERQECDSILLADRQHLGHSNSARSRQFSKPVGFGLKHLQTSRVAMFDEQWPARGVEAGT